MFLVADRTDVRRVASSHRAPILDVIRAHRRCCGVRGSGKCREGSARSLPCFGYKEYVVLRDPTCCYRHTVRSQDRFVRVMADSACSDTLALSMIYATRSREWMQRVMRLLEAAVGQLQELKHPAQRTLLEAASLLRQQIYPPPAELGPGGRGSLPLWQSRKVLEYIDTHITGAVRVGDLCALIQRSEAYFSRSFKRTFGESPHSFVTRRRVELAARYMLTTDASLSDIALRCGFADQPHLCKHFRRAVGESPAAWRRVHRMRHDENAKPPLGRLMLPWRNGAPVLAA
jgi:AraC family transcriptional regulator